MKEKTETLFHIKPYRYLITGQLVSNLGDWLSIMAVFTVMGLKWHATPLEMSLTMLALCLPNVLFGPITGVIADRFNRKQLMIITDILRGLAISGLIFATEIWHVYMLLLALQTFSCIFSPAKNGMLKEIIPDQHMQEAASISSVIESVTKIAGPMISGFLIALAGTQVVFLIDAISYFLSASLLLMLPQSKIFKERKTDEKRTFFQDLQEGLCYVKKVPLILFGTLLLFISMLILQLADSQFVVLIRELKEASPKLVGIFITASGVGFLVSGLLLTKLKINSIIRAMAFGVILLGFGYGLDGYFAYLQIANPYVWGSIITFIAGFGAVFIFVPFQASIQRKTPVTMTGRVQGVINSIVNFAAIIGPITGGILGNVFGIIPVFIASGFGLLLIGMVAFIMRRKMERSDLNAESISPAQGTTTA